MRGLFRNISLGLAVLFLSLSACKKEYSCENCKKENKSPISNAGHDLAIALPADSVLLNGSASADPDGWIVRFSWTKITGPASFTIDSAGKAVTTVSALAIGSYQFELEVTDNEGLSSKDTVSVVVDSMPVNHPPVAVAGSDTTIITPSDKVVLNGNKSWDPDNNISSYAWITVSGPSVVNMPDPVNSQTDAGNLKEGTYLFELTVTDAGGLFSKDTIKVTVVHPPGQPPVADAGKDIPVLYNLQTCSLEPPVVTLDGRASYDPDGQILKYQWSVAGSADLQKAIADPASAVTGITGLVPGNYYFRLTVTDNDGWTDDDTVQVAVTAANRATLDVQLIPVGALSQPRQVSAAVTANNKIFFAGGKPKPSGPGPSYSSRVDIYDITTDTWTATDLSERKSGITAVSSGDKVFFAGGTGLLSTGRVGLSSRIDVYSLSTGLWTTMVLPRPGEYSSVALGDKLFFAGGRAIDIYDISNDAWTSKTLSQPRYLISSVNSQGKLYFSGGASTISGGTPYSNVDIYDPAGASWAETSMTESRYKIAGVGLRGKVLWAGGITNSGMTNEVEIMDVLTGSRTFGCLFQANAFSNFSVARTGTRYALFVWDGKEKDKIDIYDGLTDTWYIGLLSQSVTPSLVISANNTIYVVGTEAGGDGYYDKVWKLQF